MKLRKSIITGTAALALIPASSAVAATINGGPGNERLKGTNVTDVINGNAGNDRIWGKAGDDQLNGGEGNDRVFGGDGNDTIAGVQGNDWLWGGKGNDTITGDANGTGDLTSFDHIFGNSGDDTLKGGDSRDRISGGPGNDKNYGENGNDIMSGGTGDDIQDGGPGNDRIYANLGVDTSYGGDGNDDLWALARGDVQAAPGQVDQTGDTLDGGNGNDTFHTRDGEVDRITCGPGNDTALLDNVDVITDATADNPNGSCEKVVRKDPKPSDSKSEDAQQSPADANKQS
ncbi:calcium-binding protein [Conexibacter woesei]|uniref:calcium-binding protein n=1 Tax=Conexibacter woesei TaxID=191495 RepID=UPI0004062D48|nr:calcium-binding protein [Conexibacter woesei]